jgi:MYXO-CTERM domain-containing protein
MKVWSVAVCAAGSLSMASVAHAQAWNRILAPSRAVDWTHAGATIPTVTTPCATQPASSNITDIQAAIDADIGGSSYCVINIPAGTTNVAGTLTFNYQGKANLVLRGAGSNKTFLVWNGPTSSRCNGLGSTNICVTNGSSGDYSKPDNSATWSGPYTPGATTINLSTVANLKVGMQMWLTQNDLTSDNGNMFICSSTSSPPCAQTGPSKGGAGHGQFQPVTVTGCGATTFGATCSSTSVTFTPGIYAPNWNTGQSPSAGWQSNLPMPIYNVGIENLSIDVSAITTSNIVMFSNAANSWESGVRQVNGTVTGQAAIDHVCIWNANHITVKDSYFYGANPQSGGYAMNPSAASGDNLFQNNICQHLPGCLIAETDIGSVYAYNYAVDNYFGSGWQISDVSHHSVGDMFELIEGNVGTMSGDDDLHGTSYALTHYRNRFSGWDPGTELGVKYDDIHAISILAGNRYNNYVGNVLGTSGLPNGYLSVYQYSAASASDSAPDNNKSIYLLGYSDQNGIPFNGTPNDPLVLQTAMRWGNYDTVNNAAQFNASENSSGASTYPGLSSPSSTLPASFYLSGSPSWWSFPSGTPSPFPGIGPDVTGGNIANVGGHAYLNPAANCYLKVMGGKTDGSSGPLTFTAVGCYPYTPPSNSDAGVPSNDGGAGVDAGVPNAGSDDPGNDDAGNDIAGNDGESPGSGQGGCSCTAAVGQGTPPAWGLLAALSLLRIRRRRTELGGFTGS